MVDSFSFSDSVSVSVSVLFGYAMANDRSISLFALFDKFILHEHSDFN